MTTFRMGIPIATLGFNDSAFIGAGPIVRSSLAVCRLVHITLGSTPWSTVLPPFSSSNRRLASADAKQASRRLSFLTCLI
jgi:hypothetical protein